MAIVYWQETPAGGSPTPYYAFAHDGHAFSRTRQASYLIQLLFAQFDPLVSIPSLPTSLQADSGVHVHIVQFYSQALKALQDGIASAGGYVRGPLPRNAVVVEMDDTTKATVVALPYVRWVGPYHPGYRLENYLRDNWAQGATVFPTGMYNIVVFVAGTSQKDAVAARVQSIGGTVNVNPSDGYILIATLTYAQLGQVIRWDEVEFVDRWSEPSVDMDIARNLGGALVLESVSGHTGQGVRGEVMEGSADLSHDAFKGICVGGTSPGAPCSTDSNCPGGTCDGEPLVHGVTAIGPELIHGTNVMGCLFGDWTDSLLPGAKGMLPDGQAIFASWCRLDSHPYTDLCSPGNVSRRTHTSELVDPSGPYRAVFQSNSWGHFPKIEYTSDSAELDDIFLPRNVTEGARNLTLCQSQGNRGTQESRPEAWSKNVVAVGGVNHHNTLGKLDDGFEDELVASYGPSQDLRVKPDFINIRDGVRTTSISNSYTPVGTNGFIGTSAATPIVAGQFGLFYQMWHEGVFPGFGGGASVFDSRPKWTTAKAMLVNTAFLYRFANEGLPSPPAGHQDLERAKQGWGLPNVGKLFHLRGKFPIIIDESVVLNTTTPASQEATFSVVVQPNTFALKATLVYVDPRQCLCSFRTVVNDLDLSLISPSSQTYWGNNGLWESNWSTPGGESDSHTSCPEGGCSVNTVENVFVKSPQAGTWQVKVFADVLTADVVPNVPPDVTVDVSFALVVSYDFDCNGNNRPDSEDLSLAPPEGSADYDQNDVPDECQGLYHVDISAPDGGDGLWWTTASNALQATIDAAQFGDRVFVKAGQYGPVTLKNGVALFGGFAGGETSPAQANYRTNVTTIAGNTAIKHAVRSVASGAGTMLRGFHIKDGNANGTGGDAHGGGLYLENSSARFVQCVFTNNDAAGNGAAVANMKDGSAVAGSPAFVNCTFHRNKDVDLSGEVLKGAAIFSEGGNINLVNCLIHKNEGRDGAGLYIDGGQATLRNCTVSDNTASNQGGGMYDKDGQAVIRNSILAFNTGAVAGDQIFNASGTTTVTYSSVRSGWPGEGNIASKYLFVDRFADNYNLVSNSPCIDAGQNSDLPTDGSDIDWDGNIMEPLPKDLAAPNGPPLLPADERIKNCVLVDMGAFEVQGECSLP